MRGNNFGETGFGHMVEPLEQRRLFAAGIDSTGVLHVVGTAGNDNIRVSLSNLDSTKLYVRVNDNVTLLVASKLKKGIIINGLAGNDRIEIDDIGLNFPATINGNAGNDSITGGTSNDRILGGDGNDTINGGLGNDTIYGEKGDDSLVGGVGKDFLDGGDGNDTIFGNKGSDRCYGRAGNDSIMGGPDNDFLDGGDGVDTIYGNDGSDIFRKTDARSEDVDFAPRDDVRI